MRAGERAYATLLDEIQSGALAPGTVLAEIEQSSRLGVSRTPLREALGRLEADGLVVQQSPRVTVVAGFDAEAIRELFEVRRALEETAARLAAQRGDAGRFRALADEFDAVPLVDGDDLDDYYALIGRFDDEIDRAVGNGFLASSMRGVRTHLVRVRRIARDDPSRLRASAGEHRTIAAAIAVRDSDLAAHATHLHLHNSLAAILAALAEPADRLEPVSAFEGAP